MLDGPPCSKADYPDIIAQYLDIVNEFEKL